MSSKTESKSCIEQNNTNEGIIVPKWLDTKFLERNLQEYNNEQHITVVKFDVNPGVGKRENFNSSLYRLNVTIVKNDRKTPESEENKANHQTVKIIVKVGISGDSLGVLLEQNIYKKEMEFYSKIAPQMKKSLKKLHETSQLIADLFGICETNTAILIEDLSAKSYGIASVYQGLSLQNAEIVLKKAATFHAINAFLQQEDENIFENFKYGIISRHSDAFNSSYLSQLDLLIELVESWPEYANYANKLRSLRPHLIERMRRAFDVNPNHFNTLIHGDMWVNNLLMKFAEASDGDDGNDVAKEAENMIFIDFQYSCWASPTVDLHLFLNSSLNESLRPNSFDELIEFYHENLVDYLKCLGYQKNIPTLYEFKQQFHDRDFYGFVVTCFDQPLVINEVTETADIEALLGENEEGQNYRRLMYQSPNVQANLRKMIPIYDRMGIFEQI